MSDGSEGAQSGAENDDQQSGQVQGNGANDQGGTTGTGAQGGAEGSGSTGETETERLLREQRERTRAADQRAGKLEQELKQLRDKDLPEAEKLKRDYEETKRQNDQLQTALREARINNAFLSDNTHKWANPKTALKLADLSGVTVEEDGSVTGLKDALNALAKSDPYLLVSDSSEGGEEDKTPGGTPPGNNGTGGGGKPPKKAMTSRLPVLRTRVQG